MVLRLNPVGAAVGSAADEAVIHQAPPHKYVVIGDLGKDSVQILLGVPYPRLKELHYLPEKRDPLPGLYWKTEQSPVLSEVLP